MTTGSELLCAVQGVQLCAPDYVIAAAQEMAQAISDRNADRYPDCFVTFLNAARYDLDYNPKRWQVWRRRKGAKFNQHPPMLTRGRTEEDPPLPD
ncbi:hypothetical protein [Streptomyces sp. NPDC058674]|uniref:hypothetical protein n=1 Tax=Streptomyces sp. NPDC058674 TaxID=3346592 RepID=UPI003651ECCE